MSAGELTAEFGIRATYLSGRIAEFTIADNLGDALEALEVFDERHDDDVISRELVQRPVGKWRKVGDGDEPVPSRLPCGCLGFCEGGPECLDDEGGPWPQEAHRG